jgi:hypothetical protein
MTIKEIYAKKKTTYLYFSELESLKAVENNGYALQFVANQTQEICLKAVENDGYALKFVANQTQEICLKAVENNGDALHYVKIPKRKMTIQEIEYQIGCEIEII